MEQTKTASYLVFEQILNHVYVAGGCSQVKRRQLVLVCIREAEHSRLPQIVHCNS